MYLSIIILPLLGSIVAGFFGRKVGVRGAQIITCLCVIATTILALLALFEVGFNNIPVTINLFRWIDSEWFNITWGFQFDSLTVLMLIPVLIISSLVHIYSIGYMSADPHNQRFFSYLSLFTFMMIILVTGNNYLLMFVGWEGVGVCSYLLISFWFTRIWANQSSISAFLTNRVGDCFLTIGMFAILWSLGNLDYAIVFSLAPYVNENVITIIGICLVIGAMAKSSQVGLHVWLPMAMEGPTPVSALIHAATMVTAGVYLLMRSSPLIEYSSTVLLICLWLGAITTVFSSLVGLFQQDIKKVIAYSTMSQLGMMVIAIGLSSYNLALFHLVNHAFYKALLFLGAGAVIHAVADNQDFRRYGGLREFLPLTYSVILIASLSLAAFPFMTGFYSKDFILESSYGQFSFSGVAVYSIATIGAIFTTLYSVKVLYLTFLTPTLGPKVNYNNAHEGDMWLMLPLIILAVFSIFFGYITKDVFLGLGSGFFQDNSIFIHPSNELVINTEFAVPTLFKLLPFFFTVSFSVLAIVISEFLPGIVLNFKLSRLGYNIYGFFNQRFLIEMFYNNYITNLVLTLGGQTTKVLDKGSVELVGPYGLEKGLISLSKSLTKLSTGVVTSYALYILVGLISFIFILYLSEFSSSLIILLILLTFFSLNSKIFLGGSIHSVTSPSHHLNFRGVSSSHPKGYTSNKLGVRHYSSSTLNTNIKFSVDFLEWFRGITDGEGSFNVTGKNPSNYFEFSFIISLHIDDINLLHYIKKSLHIGTVTSYGKVATFKVIRKQELKVLIDIFNVAPLNTTKQLNFLDFKKAFELYTNSQLLDTSLKNNILDIKKFMNKGRPDLELYKSKSYKITPYWLLGFVEGEGSFYIKSQNLLPGFRLSQIDYELPLLEAIRDFLLELPGDYSIRRNYASGVITFDKGKIINSSKFQYYLNITNNSFLVNVLIPFFDSLVWQSKKELDYKDWKTIIALKEQGKHYLVEGADLIRRIQNQMNNNRLSTFSNKEGGTLDNQSPLLQVEIENLLSLPSNYEVQSDGRILIKSLNKYYSSRASTPIQLQDEKGRVVETFDSLSDCAKYLNRSRSGLDLILRKDRGVLFEGKLLFLKKVNSL
uniref:NADH:ubiquinone reductase (H(+)-translocating) n=1 Tax=Juglanconis oblonga TaxID=1940568 RepID=A0A291LI79_9PEZI|nr:NADH dehydrogenase subunit 5 [Juglanconis oblonga]